RQWFNNLQNVCRSVRLNNYLQDDSPCCSRLPGFGGVLRFNSPDDRRHGYTRSGCVLNIVVLSAWCSRETKINIDLRDRVDEFAISSGWGKPPEAQCAECILIETKPDSFDDSNNLHAALGIKRALDSYRSLDFLLARDPRIKRIGVIENFRRRYVSRIAG